jgi:hypothetical protein
VKRRRVSYLQDAVEDTRIGDVRPLIPPACLSEDIPLSAKARDTVLAARAGCAAAIEGTDDRLVVIVGPCSIHGKNSDQRHTHGTRLWRKPLRRSRVVRAGWWREKSARAREHGAARAHTQAVASTDT